MLLPPSGPVECAPILSRIGEDALRTYNTFIFSSNEGHNSNKYANRGRSFKELLLSQEKHYLRDFLAYLKMLVRYCACGKQEESIMHDYIIQGCEDSVLQEVLLKLENTSLGNIVQHCSAVELTTMQAKQITVLLSFTTE
ncbi:hypothetical protein PR048_012747 [Dryococelus australis]|uniref:Uncharacterized protein n=1 Tax=Dryococelus australis TaxID=614101 RepID=A0ABQ9HR37_9NEOP|nr:hypothetical protein PR048_012747 [Dryococelus australis]